MGSQLQRSDRYVRRARLRTDADAPKHTLASRVEEGLRLSTLPGENEGRVYYFRQVHVRGLSESASRGAWLEAFQGELLGLARCAVHGADPAGRFANAVFFLTAEEAYTSLLSAIVRQRPRDGWYWPILTGLPAASGDAECIVHIIETLARTPASWVAVASVAFASIEPESPLSLLKWLPDARINHWLVELGRDTALREHVPPVRLTRHVRTAVERAASMLGSDDFRVLWLASLAVALVSPTDLEHGVVVQRARRSLRMLSDMGPAVIRAPPEHSDRGVGSRPLSRLPDRDQLLNGNDGADAGAPAETAELRVVERAPATHAPQRLIGEVTQGAGLYFLLNALRQLQSNGAELSLRSLACFFQLAAAHAGIENEDPILRWATLTLDEAEPVQEVPDEADEHLVRLWLLKVRRWCWHNGKITVRTIVRRPGRVTLTRTDLDVFLALDLADVRIRRIGLDLDPGWVPWFGRVVRFHYLYERELCA